ncbi:hydroxymethylglutaryl-CoA lyase [Mesorhizobium mediterraneum]|uniref:hydroxymethylglutaryl-CoA lyase n=1 Tax=Mesorhizobium mediterraneum TaxID=43617 RepID=UPI001780007F|nr:hydroxymethylglutaryl-CoA lyase [Mesorhizobium mediterraneum]
MSGSVRVVEVGPRDGLQNEKISLPVEVKVEFIRRLAAAKLRTIEAGSFVSPKRVPQMADTAEVLRRLQADAAVRYPVLVPNTKGMEDALAAGAGEVAVFASASETFSRKNIGCSIAESIERFRPVLELAKARSIAVRGYVSCVLGCPYEGQIAAAAVGSVSRQLVELGCYEIALSDTIGIGTPRQARDVVRAVADEIGIGMLAVHFHDTRGQALANILACLEEGVAVVDSAVAGLGGCPYAPGASGNVSTEDLVFMLEGMGVSTGVNLGLAVEAGRFISAHLGRGSGSKVAQAMVSHGDPRQAM